MVLTTRCARETAEAGALFAQKARPGDIFALVGGLGTGKTEFARGFVGSLDPRVEVTSPSFSIVNVYHTAFFPVYHFDFYRLDCSQELVEIGFDEYLEGEGVCLIEWADLFPELIPASAHWVIIREESATARTITVQSDPPAK